MAVPPPLVPEPLAGEFEFFPLEPLEPLVGVRSENRLVDPRAAPKLAAGPELPPVAVPEEPGVPVEPDDEEDGVPDEGLPPKGGMDEDDEPPAPEVPLEDLLDELDELELLDPPPPERFPPPPPPPPGPPPPPRFPNSCGAFNAANLSAAITPLTRRVRFRSPTTTVAVRVGTASAFPARFSDVAVCFRYRAMQPRKRRPRNTHNPRFCGFRGAGRTICGRGGAVWGTGVPMREPGAEALLMWDCMSTIQTSCQLGHPGL
jgi:hypothetical protein